MSEIHVNDIGTTFTVTIREGKTALDISTATTKDILFKRPDKTLLTVAGAFVTDGTDGKIIYTTVDGDLNDKGRYCIQAKVVTAAGSWNSEVDFFEVFKNLVS